MIDFDIVRTENGIDIRTSGGGSVSLNGQPIITAQDIDDELSSISTNPVQNNVIAKKFNNLIEIKYATINSTNISDGRVYYFKIGNVVIVEFASVVFTSTAISGMGSNNTTVIVSGLPNSNPLSSQPVILTNLISEEGHTVRVTKSWDGGQILGWWDAPKANEKYCGVLVYRCE